MSGFGSELVRGVALMAATVTTGLMAGLFWAFSIAVMPGLGRADDRTFVDAMQRMIVAILNGWFAVCFGGALVFTALAVLLHVPDGRRAVLPWLLAALLLYVVVLAVTFAVNVPLNDRLAAVDLSGGAAVLAAARAHFEAAWARWNIVRTALSTVAFGCLAWALVVSGRS